ncbi:hypothetical protein CGRA01v4_06389 [Colletotrichum graminicola]|nr:hypothetical protein CGRA01v4_06389 [Colletotrichum graminicola]
MAQCSPVLLKCSSCKSKYFGRGREL